MNQILDVMEDIKQNITDSQYKIIMDSLMEINKIETKNKNIKSTTLKCITLMNWLDSKLKLEPKDYKQIKKTKLQEFIIKNLYDYKYYENIDFVKKVLDLYFFRIPKKQASNLYYQCVKFRDDDEEED
jgi:hypothetical protein